MPLDRGIMDQQLQALGEGARWWNQLELRDLPAVLHADERILAVARGKIARVRVMRRSWLIVVTDRRLLCLRSGTGSWRQVEIAANQITRIALRVGPFRGRVLVVAGGHRYRLLVPRADAYRLMNALETVAPTQTAVPGFTPTRVVRRVMDHVLALPAVAMQPGGAPAPVPPPQDTSGLESRVQLLEDEVQELRRQVEFLEQLLRERHALDRSLAPPAPGQLPGERIASSR